MYETLTALANGKVIRTGPLLQFSSDKVELEVLEGHSLSGHFTATVLNDGKVRGVCLATGLRMNCLTPQFEGTSVTIRYEYDSTGLREGDIEKGYFSLICNQCEYSLSFVVTIVRPYALSATGKIRTIADFSRLAETNWEEAGRIFRSTAFRGLFKEGEENLGLLYRMLLPGASCGNSMNEFLIAGGKKDRNTLCLERESVEFPALLDKSRESLMLRMEGYGGFSVSVSSDAAFMEPCKTLITEEDLIGKSYEFSYMLDPRRIHAGINRGHIIFRDGREEKRFTVTVRGPILSEEEKKERELKLEVKKNLLLLGQYYLSYRLKRMVTGEWTKKTVDICRHLLALQPDNSWWKLIQAQAFLVNRQKQDARWILDAWRRERLSKDNEIYGYFLYLCTLSEREKGYVDKVSQEVEDIYRRHPESLILFWVRLFLKEEFMESDSRRLDAIKLRFDFGAASPFLYLEAFLVMHQDPALITRLDPFEIRVLWWAARNDALSRDLVLQLSALTSMKKDFDPVLVRLLKLAYEVFPGDDLVLSVCSYLIRTDTYGPRYFWWFEKGVELNLRVTGLSEAYLLSLEEGSKKELPKVIQMYFRYETPLPDRKVALLFERIVREKKENMERYLSFRRSMESFAIQEMNDGQMNESLAVIYHDLLKDGLINREIAIAMESMMFSFLVQCPNPNMAALHVKHQELKEEQTIPLKDGKAFISLYTRNYCIVAEDREGRRYSALGADITIQPLMRPHDYLKRCMERSGLREKYVLYDIAGKENITIPLTEKKEELIFLLEDEGITDAYKAKLLPLVLKVYEGEDEAEELLAYVRKMDVALPEREVLSNLTSLLIEKRYYEEAYELVLRIGAERMDPQQLVPLMTAKIREKEFEEEETLKSLVLYTFLQKKYNEDMLTYLCRYLNGTTEDMASVYRHAKGFGLETYDLAERILAQMLYTGRMEPDAFSIFRDYLEEGGRELYIEAYLNYTADAYFVRGVPAEPEILELLRRREERGEEQSQIEELAVLYYFSQDPTLAEGHIKEADALLSRMLSRGLFFPFYLSLPRRLMEKYQLYDKTFLEFRTDPKKQVYIHFSLPEQRGEYQVQEMQHMYGGIFVAQFVLFFGESLQYYITEEDDEMEKVAMSGEITKSDVFGEETENRFDALNAVLLHTTLQEEEELTKALRSYEAKDAIARSRFPVL